MNRSKVFKAYGAWHAYSFAGKHYESFPTWAEAMAYAHRGNQMQAITIKDPSGAFCDLTAINKHRYINIKAGGDTFNIAPHEWRPLARFLLDVDDREGQA